MLVVSANAERVRWVASGRLSRTVPAITFRCGSHGTGGTRDGLLLSRSGHRRTMRFDVFACCMIQAVRDSPPSSTRFPARHTGFRGVLRLMIQACSPGRSAEFRCRQTSSRPVARHCHARPSMRLLRRVRSTGRRVIGANDKRIADRKRQNVRPVDKAGSAVPEAGHATEFIEAAQMLLASPCGQYRNVRFFPTGRRVNRPLQNRRDFAAPEVG